MARRRRRWREQPRPDEPTAPRRRRVALGVVALTGALLALALLKPPIIFGEPPHYGNKVGDLAPGFTLQDAKGSPLSLSEYRNWVILVDFMGARCSGCRDQLAALADVHRGFRERDFVIISLDVGERTDTGDGARNATELKALMEPYTAGDQYWRIALGDLSVRVQYGVSGLPTLFLLDRTGKIRVIDGAADSALISGQIKPLLEG